MTVRVMLLLTLIPAAACGQGGSGLLGGLDCDDPIGLYNVTSGLLPAVAGAGEVWGLPVSDGRRVVYGAREVDGAAPGDFEVWAFDAEQRSSERLSDNREDDLVIDARDGALLVGSLDHGRSGRLLFRDDRMDWWPIGLSNGWLPGADGREVRVVGPGRAVWPSHLGVTLWSTVDSYRCMSVGGTPYPVLGPPGRAGWVATTTTYTSVQAWADRDWKILVREAAAHSHLVVDRDWLAWLNLEERVILHDRTTSQTISDPGCGALSGDQGVLVMACGARSESPRAFATLTFYVNGRRIPVPTGGGAIRLPRVSGPGARVAWVEYDPSFDPCGPPAEGAVGSVMFFDAGVHAAPVELARVSAGCTCCDRPGPPATLSFRGNVLTWNYAVTSTGGAQAATSPASVGWARVEKSYVCPE